MLNPGKKPRPTISKRIEDDDTWDRMLGEVLDQRIHPNLAIRFMYDYAVNDFIEESPDNWVSYDVMIRRKRARINPSSLLSVAESNEEWTSPEGEGISDEDRLRLFIIILAEYRYGIASEIIQGEYKAIILNKINQVDPYNLDSDITPTELAG